MIKNTGIKNNEIKAKIAESLRISHFTKTQQDKIISLLTDSVALKVTAALWSGFSEKEKKELNNMAEKKMLDYINAKAENSSELVENITRQVVSDFRAKV